MFSSPHQVGYQPTAQYQPARNYQPGYSGDPQQSSLPATPVQAQVQPSPQLVRFSSPHQVGYQPTAQYQPARNYQPGYSGDPQQSSLPATPVQAQVQPSPQLVRFSSPHQVVYQQIAQYQPAIKYQPGYSGEPQQMSWPATPVQAQVQPSPQLVRFSSPHQVGYQPTAQYQPAKNYQPGYSGDPQQSSLQATPVQAQVQPSPQLVRFSSPHQVVYQQIAQYQPARKYQPGYSGDPQQMSWPATPVQAQVQHPPQLVGYPSQYQPMSQYQPTSHCQPMSRHQPITQYQPMAQHQRTAQYQPNQFPVQRQKPTGRKTAEPSKPPVLPKNLVFDGKTNWTLFKQKFESYATAAGWTDEKKTDMLIWGLKGKAADFYVLLCNMNEDLSYKHLISEFGKRFKREELPETLQARFQNECQEEGETLRDWADRILTLAAKAYKDLPEAWIRRHAIIRFCMGCLDLEAGQHACTQQPKSFVEAMDKMEWFQCINKTSKPRRPSLKTTKSDPLFNAYTCKSYDDYDTDSCSEEDDESEGYLQSTINSRQNISPYSSIHRTYSGLIPRNEFPQSGTSTQGLTEVARQMSKVSDEMSTLCSNVSDLTSGIKNMLCEIDNGALQRSSCFTCGSPQHMAKECPSSVIWICLFDLILLRPINNLSVIKGWVFLD